MPSATPSRRDRLTFAMPRLSEARATSQAKAPMYQPIDEAPNNVGLVAEELLALTLDSGDAHPVGEWQANAGLFLKTPVDVAPGSYSATITLTLWEDEY